jgi:hypothetical protein
MIQQDAETDPFGDFINIAEKFKYLLPRRKQQLVN